ncbi:MAG: peptidoglycan-binding domain-containing protein [Lachnospiraceae bacterium]|nr:peptidoglycan-binding domain-containing protein [Lachnospiraceae bacterium]
MKKQMMMIALSLGCMLAVPAVSYAENMQAVGEVQTDSKWALEEYIDDFGDPTGEKYAFTSVVGEFSNTATTGSELQVFLYFEPYSDKGFSARLLEYGDHPLSVVGISDIEVKYKVDGEIYAHTVPAYAVASDKIDFGAADGMNWDLHTFLSDGKDIQFVIYIGSSKYSFAVSADGYEECLDAFFGDIYDSAQELFEQEQYEEAKQMFESVALYKDAEEKAAECENKGDEGVYNTAVELMDNGDYEGAKAILEEIADYKDAADKITECENSILEATFNSALDMMSNQEFEEALTVLEEVAESVVVNEIVAQEDIEDIVGECKMGIMTQTCNAAVELMNNEEFEEARKLLEPMLDYEEAKELYAYCLLGNFTQVYEWTAEVVNYDFQNSEKLDDYLRPVLCEENMLTTEEIWSELSGLSISIALEASSLPLPDEQKYGPSIWISNYNYVEKPNEGSDTTYLSVEPMGTLKVFADRSIFIEKEELTAHPYDYKELLFKIQDGVFVQSRDSDGSMENLKPMRLIIRTDEVYTETDQVLELLGKLAAGEEISVSSEAPVAEEASAEEADTIYEDAATIQKVQEALNSAGFDCGTPDGVAGNGTYAALNAYQEANGLTVENVITGKLLKAMGIE